MHLDNGIIRLKHLRLLCSCSGSGKTVVINILNETVESDGGFFLTAKFDRFQHGDLHAVLSEVFSGLQNLEYSEDLKVSLRNALRDEGPLLGQIIPGLHRQLYSGSTGSLTSTSSGGKKSSTNARWSFELLKILLRNFLKVLCQFHKIVLFLDDLQWSDKSYLDLISTLLHDPELQDFLFVGSYRSNELDSDHHLFGHIEDLENMECATKLKVQDLQPQSCNELIANLLHLDLEETEGLSAAVYKKTLGNAFFMLQFIEMPKRSELLWYSFANLKWEFNLPKILGETSLADNIVDAVVGKLQQLDVASQNALKIAAGLGNRFDPLIIEYLLEKMPGNLNVDGNGIKEILEPCINEDLIAIVEIKLDDSKDKKLLYKFSHDKIHQASYSLISVRERSHFHLMLGRNLRGLLKSLVVDGNTGEDWILQVVSDDVERSVDLGGEETGDLQCDKGWLLLVTTDQLNQSRELLDDPVELLELAKTNLQAAKALHDKAAFFPASSFADNALELLGGTKWTDQYQLSLEAMTMGLELDHYVGRGERCISRVGEVLMHANTLSEKFRAYFTLLDYHNNNRDHEKARNVGHDLLRQLGVKMPKTVSMVHVGYQFMLALKLVGNRSDEDLLSIPLTDSEKVITKIKIFFSLLSPSYWTDRMNEFAYMVMVCMKLTLKEGTTEMAGAIFSSFGGMCAGVGKTNAAFRFGRLGKELNHTIGAKAYLCKSIVKYYSFVFHMRNPYYASLDTFLEARRIGMEVGDLDYYSSNAAFCYFVSYYLSGLQLSAMAKDGKLFTTRMLEYK